MNTEEIEGKLSKILLPIGEPIISGRMNYAFPLTILSGYDIDYIPWFLNNFINLKINHKKIIHRFNFADNTDDESVYVPVISYTKTNRQKISNDIVDYLIDSIQNGTYVSLQLNKFFISSSDRYHRSYFPHPILFYGFDKETKVFHTMSYYKEQKYSIGIVPFDEVEDGYYIVNEQRENQKDISLFRFLGGQAKININQITTSLYDFLYPNDEVDSLCVSGINVYDLILQSLSMLRERKISEFLVYKNFHVMIEHNKSMELRIRYLLDHKYISNVKLLKAQESLTLTSLLLRNLTIKYKITREVKLLDRIYVTLLEFIDEQKRHWNSLLIHLS